MSILQRLSGKRVLLGISGGVAAYKACQLVRELVKVNAQVQVVMTEKAQTFVSALTLQSLSGQRVRTDLFDESAEAAMGHIELARWADLMIIAPASANTIANLALGLAPDLLSTLYLATKAPCFICPAMNQAMYHHPAVEKNIQTLKINGVSLVGPVAGEQACGDVGLGRLMEPLDILHTVATSLMPGTLQGLSLAITAGPTVEPICPVRFLSNHSSGKMGYALARAASALGAKVTLISGPTALTPPGGVETILVNTADEMYQVALSSAAHTHIFIGAAAVSDYSPVDVAKEKIKKNEETLTLTLKKNKDIIAEVSGLERRPFVVGFAAETEHLRDNAHDKLRRKSLDMIIANQVSKEGIGFHVDDNEVIAIDKVEEKSFAKQPKADLAYALLEHIYERYKGSQE